MSYFRLLSETGRRERWTIKLRASELIKHCLERIDYHDRRVAYWRHEQQAAEERLKNEGIQLRHFPVTGGQRVEAQLDNSLAQRVSECQNKLKDHQDARARFHAFRAFLSVAGDAELELNADDVLYFNLGEADCGEE